MHKLTLRSYFKPHKIDTCLCHFPFSTRSNKQYGQNRVVLKFAKGVHNYMLVLVPATVISRSPYSSSVSQPKILTCNDFFGRNLHTTCLFYDKKNSNKSAEKNEQKVDQTASAKSIPSAKYEKEARKRKIDYSKIFTERNFITPLRAMNEYLLKPSDLESLRKIQRRSPFEDNPPIYVYLRRDVEQKSIEVWGSQEALQREIKKRQEEEQLYRDSLFNVKRILKEYSHATMHQEELKRQEMILRTSGRVVMTAVIMFVAGLPIDLVLKQSIKPCRNATNFALKLFAWLYTGSHTMFAEAIHSLADTGNQLLLAYGIKKSLQTPTEYHPYGYHSMRYVAALVSGVGIFFLGAGLSFYHGIMGILIPDTMESLYWAYIVLGGSLVSEGGTLAVAFRETRRGAKREGMTFAQYVLRGQDPSVNVVLLEDIAAVFGIFIAGGCMGLTSYTGLPIYDAIGSLAIGGVLGVVASFIIYTNAAALVGRSIPAERLLEINKEMENDIMIRAIHDVKATDMGNNYVRYKAEVDFDGRELTRSYLDSQDLDNLLTEMQELKTIEDVESFMLKHGESIVDMLGGEIDRIEITLKKKHPEIRHVDLEVL